MSLQDLEQQHQGQHILLVSHGDTLSILQATYHSSPLTQHRQYGLATAELKCLNATAALQGLASGGGSGGGIQQGSEARELAAAGVGV